MKKIIVLLFLFQSMNYSQEMFKGDILISDLSVECIDTTYIVNPLYKSRPTNIEYEKNKLVYEVILTIRLYGNEFSYNNALALTFSTPDNNSATIIINQELYDLRINEDYEYILNIQSKNGGLTGIDINEWDMYSLSIVKHTNVNFIDYSFYLE